MTGLFDRIAASLCSLTMAGVAVADTTVNTFDDFTSGALYASWMTATIDSGPTAYSISATGYGSNWKYNPVDASGETTVRLAVTLNSGGVNKGKLGPIVTLVDADGSSYNFAWYGLTNGSYVLTKPVTAPTWVDAAGTVAGLDLAKITHLHLALDPSDYKGDYTVTWEGLELTGAPSLAITARSYNPATREFSLTWRSRPGKSYSVLHSASLAGPFSPLVADIPSTGVLTTTTVILPSGDAGFLRIEQP